MCKSQTTTNKCSTEGDGVVVANGAASSPLPLTEDIDNSPSNSSSTKNEPCTHTCTPLTPTVSSISSPSTQLRRRRRKRDRQASWSKDMICSSNHTATSLIDSSPTQRIVKKKKRSKMTNKHADDSKSGGLDALLPSLICVIILAFMLMAKLGFRGRATVCGIDLGTTNSVVCVQSPSSKGVGEITCIPDPATNSSVIPSVVSFLDHHYQRSFRLTKDEKKNDIWPASEKRSYHVPHPVDVVVGQSAKARINSHPHHTIYHAKRIIGREYDHESVTSLIREVDFDIVAKQPMATTVENDNDDMIAAFNFPYHMPPPTETTDGGSNGDHYISTGVSASSSAVLSPSDIGSYIIHHLRTITRNYLQHDNIQSAVIAIPAKFGPSQRDATIRAFELAGLRVARILEEPTAAALAYGLHKRDDVHYIMVYDFGGGTLDISMLYIGEGGYIEVLGSDGDEQLGGADFDAAVAHWLLEQRGGEEIVKDVMTSVARIEEKIMLDINGDNNNLDVEDLIEQRCPKLKEVPLCTISSMHTMAEEMKIELSSHPNELESVAEASCYRLPPSMEDEGATIPSSAEELCGSILKVKLSLSLEEYDQAVDHLYKQSLVPIQRLLKDLNLRTDEVDEVVMVGGTTRMPQIQELVSSSFGGKELNKSIDPDLTVAYGAASCVD